MTDRTNLPVSKEGKRELAPGRWDPFAEIRAMEAEMDRWMNAFWPLGRRTFTVPAAHPTAAEKFWTPRMDVYQKEGQLVIKAELPGLKPEDVEVTIEDGDLIVKGERKAEKEVKEKDFYRMERSYGEFYRRQPLPEGIKPEQIKATFVDGILEVAIPAPKEEKAEVKKINVTSK